MIRRDERGSGTILVAGLASVLVMVAYAAVLIATYVVCEHRVRRAADLASLAGAVAFRDGRVPCEAAASNAKANGVSLVACDQVGDQSAFVVSATVRVAVPLVAPGLPHTLEATSHGGSA